MNDNAILSALSEARNLAARPRFWWGFAGLVLLLGLTGPFGTYDRLPLMARFLYWMVVSVTTFWLGFVVSMIIATLAENRGVPLLVAVGIGGMAASLPISVILTLIDAAVFGTPSEAVFLHVLPYVMVISSVVALLFEAVEARAVPIKPTSTPIKTPTWVHQLPAELGQDLIWLHAQDHYVLARTAQGQVLVRASISDAAKDLGDYGLRVHRSWWVAYHGIDRSENRKGRAVLVLHDGTCVPVGRSYRTHVRTALRAPL